MGCVGLEDKVKTELTVHLLKVFLGLQAESLAFISA